MNGSGDNSDVIAKRFKSTGGGWSVGRNYAASVVSFYFYLDVSFWHTNLKIGCVELLLTNRIGLKSCICNVMFELHPLFYAAEVLLWTSAFDTYSDAIYLQIERGVTYIQKLKRCDAT